MVSGVFYALSVTASGRQVASLFATELPCRLDRQEAKVES